MDMFYLIDTSGSMNYNGCLHSINKAMPEIAGILSDISRANRDQGEIYISCITFGDDATLLYERPVAATDFRWADVGADGLTNLGAAFTLLEKQMHRGSGLGSAEGHLRPAVILLTDGDPDPGWEAALEKLKQNRWFDEAYKIAIAIGAGAANVGMKRAVTQFARPSDPAGKPMIISVRNLRALQDTIRLVSSAVSRVGSRSAGARDSVSQMMHRSIAEGIDPVLGVYIPPITDEDDSFWD